MIRRAWHRATRTWREAAAIIADEQARAQSPVPGQQAPPTPAHGRPPRPAPAPVFPAVRPPPPPPGHPSRHLRKRIDVLLCGCTYIYDARDAEWNIITCGPSLDEELRELLETAADACPGCGTPPGTWCPQWCEYAKDHDDR